MDVLILFMKKSCSLNRFQTLKRDGRKNVGVLLYGTCVRSNNRRYITKMLQIWRKTLNN